MQGNKGNHQKLSSIQEQLAYCSDIVYYPITLRNNCICTLIYSESIINVDMLNQFVITPLLSHKNEDPKKLHSLMQERTLFPIETDMTTDVDEVIQSVLQGKVAITIDGQPIIVLVKLTEYESRSVPESQNEIVIIGPHEAFNENLDTNLSLLRHQIKHPQFKNKKYTIGKFSRTKLRVLYMEGICDPQLLHKITKQLQQIETERVVGSNFIAEQLSTNKFSPFPLIQFTERPDTLASSLLEGRIGVMVDGSPIALLLPVTFFSLLLSTEDYYQSFLAASWVRWIRIMFVIVSFLLPSTYVALTTFHPHMIPTELLTTIASAREKIPFTTIVEALMMELLFEGLREAGLRIPKPIGQTVSIIGAIVIGQAAVQAGIVSAPIVIVVSITGIASYIIPHFELSLAFRLLRFPVMLLGGIFGLLGIVIAVYIIYSHLISLDSFGTPYMKPLAPLDFRLWKDTFIRSKWSSMNQKIKPFGKRNS